MSLLPPKSVVIPAVILVGVGLWLAVSPWILPGRLSTAAIVSDELSAAALMLLAVVQAILWRTTAPSWVATAVGLWVLFSPWICGYDQLAIPMRNDTVAGILAVLAVSAALIAVFALEERRRAKAAA